jgi:6,7-dimethyl-8-ribityllumazine synthase
LKIESVPEAAMSGIAGRLDASGRRFAIVTSRFNSFITERLLLSACDGLIRTGATQKDIDIVRVPGAFEVPSAARTLALTGKYDALICIGCLLRGDTAHYDVIVNEVTRGIGQSAQETGVPHAFGVLTCDTLEQAIDRAGLKMGNKGFEAALAAVEMVSLKAAISVRPSAVRKKQIPSLRLRSGLRPAGSGKNARNDKAMRKSSKKRK